MSVNGNQSIRNLYLSLISKYGELAFKLVGGISDETDAIGWKMRKAERYLFSVSTLAGELPVNVFDMEISIADDSLENGDIHFNEEVNMDRVLALIEEVLNGKFT